MAAADSDGDDEDGVETAGFDELRAFRWRARPSTAARATAEARRRRRGPSLVEPRAASRTAASSLDSRRPEERVSRSAMRRADLGEGGIASPALAGGSDDLADAGAGDVRGLRRFRTGWARRARWCAARSARSRSAARRARSARNLEVSEGRSWAAISSTERTRGASSSDAGAELGGNGGLGEADAEIVDELDISLRVLSPTPRRCRKRAGGVAARSATVLMFSRSRTFWARVERLSDRMGVSAWPWRSPGARGGVGHMGVGEARFGEGGVPGDAHFGGGVEALFGIAAQRAGEKAAEGLANLGIKEVGGDGDFVGDEMRRALAVAPSGECAGRHFIEDQGGGEPFGGGIPTMARRQGMAPCSPGVPARMLSSGQAGKREIEQLEMELLGVLADADVVWLEVAVGDAFVLEVFEDGEEVVAEALQEFAGEATVLAETVSKRAFAGELARGRRRGR